MSESERGDRLSPSEAWTLLKELKKGGWQVPF